MNKESVTSEQFSTEWQDGDHTIYWYKTAKGRARAIAEFFGSGKNGGALMAVILPLRQLEETDTHLRRIGFPVDSLMEQGRLLLFASEELLPTYASDIQKIAIAFADLNERAEKKGYRLILAGSVAPVLLEHGELDKAMAVEMTADSALGRAKLLCLYDFSNLKELDEREIDRINGVHTEILYESDVKHTRNRKGKTTKSTKRRRR